MTPHPTPLVLIADRSAPESIAPLFSFRHIHEVLP
jgi:hypothetical protein